MAIPDFLLQPANLVIIKAISRLFIISALGFLAVRFGLLAGKAVECLSRFVIAVALPCLIIATLGRNLDYGLLPEMGRCLVAASLLNLGGLAAALLIRRLFVPTAQPGRRMFLTLASIQNSGYLPIPLALAILPADQRTSGLLFVFVYLLVMGLIFWSVGVWLIRGATPAGGLSAGIGKLFNPPMTAMLGSLLFLAPPVKQGFNALPLLQEGLQGLGNTTVPLVLFILGGSFAAISPGGGGRLIIKLAALLKLLIIPTTALAAILLLDLSKTFAFVLMLQAAMPAALNHIVVAQEYHGDVQLTSRALFVQYLLSLLTVPFFLLLFNHLYQ